MPELSDQVLDGGSHLRLEFKALKFDAVNDSTPAEVAIGVEADFAIFDGSTVIVSEPCFEVLLLAQELEQWIGRRDGSDFIADLGMVWEYPGIVRIVKAADGWLVSSDLTRLASPPYTFAAIEAAVRSFVTDVKKHVAAAGYAPGLSQ